MRVPCSIRYTMASRASTFEIPKLDSKAWSDLGRVKPTSKRVFFSKMFAILGGKKWLIQKSVPRPQQQQQSQMRVATLKLLPRFEISRRCPLVLEEKDLEGLQQLNNLKLKTRSRNGRGGVGCGLKSTLCSLSYTRKKICVGWFEVWINIHLRCRCCCCCCRLSLKQFHCRRRLWWGW